MEKKFEQIYSEQNKIDDTDKDKKTEPEDPDEYLPNFEGRWRIAGLIMDQNNSKLIKEIESFNTNYILDSEGKPEIHLYTAKPITFDSQEHNYSVGLYRSVHASLAPDLKYFKNRKLKTVSSHEKIPALEHISKTNKRSTNSMLERLGNMNNRLVQCCDETCEDAYDTKTARHIHYIYKTKQQYCKETGERNLNKNLERATADYSAKHDMNSSKQSAF